jgi:two-component system phosphate regulon response regulator PhoB
MTKVPAHPKRTTVMLAYTFECQALPSGELYLALEEPQTFRVIAEGQTLKMGPTEFRLLHYLMRNLDRVLSRSKLLDGVWGDHVFIEERTVDVHIRRLRLALQPSGHDRLVETVRGGGYRFLPQ